LTDPGPLATTTAGCDEGVVTPPRFRAQALERRFELCPEVSLRRDRLGTRVYDRRTRRLRYLRPDELSELVEALVAGRTLGAVLEAVAKDAEQRASLLGALSELSAAGILRERT
jgi:putative mycofactocin binding protein MftB